MNTLIKGKFFCIRSAERISRHFIVTVMCLVMVSGLLPAQSKTQRQLEALERQRFEAMTSKNTAFLQMVLDERLAYTHSNGFFETKAAHIENIRTEKLVYEHMQPETMEVVVHGRAAVIIGTIRVEGIYNGKTFNMRLRYTDMYVKKRGKWRLVAWQSQRMEA